MVKNSKILVGEKAIITYHKMGNVNELLILSLSASF